MNSKNKRNQTTLRIPPEIDAKITSLAQNMGISKNAYILMLITQALQTKQILNHIPTEGREAG